MSSRPPLKVIQSWSIFCKARAWIKFWNWNHQQQQQLQQQLKRPWPLLVVKYLKYKTQGNVLVVAGIHFSLSYLFAFVFTFLNFKSTFNTAFDVYEDVPFVLALLYSFLSAKKGYFRLPLNIAATHVNPSLSFSECILLSFSLSPMKRSELRKSSI